MTAVLLALGACAQGPIGSASLEPRELSGLWAFHPGDDPTWATPGFDDSDWIRLQVPGTWRYQGFDHLTGVAWYRLRVPSFWPAEETLGFTLGTIDSAYEVYVGGRRLGGVGALPPNPRIEYERYGTYFIPPAAREPDGPVVVALRIWRAPQVISTAAGPVEGPFEIGPLSRLIERQMLTEAQQLALSLLFVLVAVYCLTLGIRPGSGAEYVWFGGLALLGAVHGFLRTQLKYVILDDFVVLKKVEHLALWLVPAMVLQFLWVFFKEPNPRWLRPVQIAFVAGALTVAITPGLVVPLALVPVLQLSVVPLFVVSLALVIRRLDAGDREARIVGLGVALFGATVIHDVLVDRNYFLNPRLAIYGFAALVASMSATLGKRSRNAFRDRDMLTQEFETRIASRTRELSHAYQEMEQIALWDGLTHILSRRAIRDRAEGELARTRRYRTPFALAIIDIDRFKTVNDTCGHVGGDRVLVQVTERLVQAVRASDDLGRWGGDEFIVLMPGTDQCEAAAVGERLRNRVAATPMTISESTEQTITVSVGLAAIDGDRTDLLDLDTLLGHADEALYRAKANGRNSVSIGEAGTFFLSKNASSE